MCCALSDFSSSQFTKGLDLEIRVENLEESWRGRESKLIFELAKYIE